LIYQVKKHLIDEKQERKMKDTFGLLMTIRDEAPVIARAINSVKILTDKYVICDTGPSTDGTQDIVKESLSGIEGHLLYYDWIDYGTNRSYSAEKAYKLLDTEYIILLDADEVIEKPDLTPLTLNDRTQLLTFLRSHPETNVFTMTTHYEIGSSIEEPIKYPRYQILRNNQLYRWELPYQEELIFPTSEFIHIDFIVNHAKKEGYNSRNPGQLRDHIEKYNIWLIDHPNHTRATFYMARTYQDLNDIENAMIWYEKFLTLSDVSERVKRHEIYVSLINLARLYIARKRFEDAINKLKDGIQRFPFRLEFYFELMNVYSDYYHQDQKALDLGSSISVPIFRKKLVPIDVFVETDIYEWKFEYKLAMVAWHANDKDQSYKTLKRLLDENKIPLNEIHIIQNLCKSLFDENVKKITISSYIGTGAAFKEFTLLLQDTLTEMDYSHNLTKEPDDNNLNIIIGSAHTPEYYLQKEMPSDTILVNLEQLYDGCIWEDSNYIPLLSKYRVWDYSQTNIEWLLKRGIKAELFRRHYSQSLLFSHERKEEIDILFFGAITEGRRKIREELQIRLPGKKICFYVNLWGKERDQIIAKSKIVLNIHGYPSNIFESSRVCHLLSNKVFVISEISVDDQDYPELESGLIKCDREEIVETVAKYLSLDKERERIAEKGYQVVRNFKSIIPLK
jgi:tetratricopeptide (TPR) repeat protein